mmetsp:Transcript_2364/g.5439  ORF Transcript_2364/g.5439 Transcript_2364/m.5439 type:complete len:252 (-) Transcript_2364:4377-5132(-)
MKHKSNQIPRHTIVVVGNMPQGFAQTIFIPQTNLRDFTRAHRTFSSASVGTKWQPSNPFVKDNSVCPNIVGRMSRDRNNTRVIALLPHWVVASSLFQPNGFRRMIETTGWIGGSAERDASSNSQHLPPTTKFANVVGAKIAMNESMLVKMEQRDTDAFHGLLWELFSVLSHVKHEILCSCISSFHRDAVSWLSHCFRIGCVLDRVMHAYHSGNIVSRQMVVFSNLQFSFYNFRFRCELGNDLLTFLSADQA